MKKRFLLYILSLLSFYSITSAQNKLPSIGGEKLYIHTDKSTYIAGDIVWLRCYLENSSYISLDTLSSFVYVELIGDTIVSRIKIRDSEDGFAGHLVLPKDLNSGIYTIRGYTKWMQNFPLDFMFSKDIRVLSPLEKKETPPNKNTKNIDISFFPESGRYFGGYPSKVAFKAIGSDGLSVYFEGELYNNKGELLNTFNPKHKGMGVINFLSVDSCGYYVIANTLEGDKVRFDMPKVETNGASISLTRVGENIHITSTIINQPDSVKYRVILHNGDENYHSYELKGDSDISILKEKSLPTGVNSVSIMSSDGVTLAERLFYIYPKNSPKADLTFDKSLYYKRDLVNVKFSVKDLLGNPVSGNFSVSVTDSLLVQENENRENITSYFLLSSELKGNIEDAGYYFNNPSFESDRYLDVLMLSQGWRYHYLSYPPAFKKEFGQTISGNVSGLFTKSAKNTILMIFAPSLNLQKGYVLDNKSDFTIEGLSFTDSTSFLLGISGKKGGQLYGLEITPEEFPRFFRIPKMKDFQTKNSAKSNSSNSSQVNPDNSSIEQRQLRSITVNSTGKELINPKQNGSPLVNFNYSKHQLKQRAELEEFDHMSIIDFLILNYSGLYAGTNEMGNRVLLTDRGRSLSSPAQPALFVDGLPWNDTERLDLYGMTIMDCENIAFVKGNQGAFANTMSGVIIIKTRRGRLNKKVAPSNIAKISPLGYQKCIKFYSPKYDTDIAKSSPKIDLRNTLYWNPYIMIDSLGNASFSFYAGDKRNNLNIRIEGLLNNGDPIVKNGVIRINPVLRRP